MRKKKINFMDEIVKMSFSNANASRSPLRNKKLSEKFIKNFVLNHLTRYYSINYDEILLSDNGTPVKCDVVIRRGGIIKSVINFRFPVSSLKKNENNSLFNTIGKAFVMENQMNNVLNKEVKVFFISFYPNTENITPDNFLGNGGFKRCRSIQAFYDVNDLFYQMQEDYKNNLFKKPIQSVVDSYRLHFGDFQDVKNAVYN